MHAARLLTDTCHMFVAFGVDGMEANLQRIREYMESCLMLVTALNPYIGYDKAAKLAKTAHHNGLSLREANRELTILHREGVQQVFAPREDDQRYPSES
jgi:fumarate hydratase, class II